MQTATGQRESNTADQKFRDSNKNIDKKQLKVKLVSMDIQHILSSDDKSFEDSNTFV